jgi:hypothetical protein|tara:strand:+ start:300 stop:683 length:384 start_codon:yes stop_codon:yes gene_type:complete
MSDLKLCQGPDCHTYHTQDRFKGTKPNKTYQTRRRSSFYYGGGNFCDMRCQNDWINKYIEQGLDHFGRLTEAKHLTKENAWTKDYDYNWRSETNQHSNWRSVNQITKEQRPLTEAQYNDTSYTLNER